MVNFSKVMRSLLKEQHHNVKRSVSPNLQQRLDEVTGQGGLDFEQKAIDNILPQYKGGARFEKAPDMSPPTKTDVIEKRQDGNNKHYSVKIKRNNDSPIKVHQTGEGKKNPSLYQKIGLYDMNDVDLSNENNFNQQIKEDPLKRALSLNYGSPFNNNMMPFKDMRKSDPEAFEALSKHLKSNKFEIFKSLALENFNDEKPIDKLLSFHNDNRGGWGDNGMVDIRDMSEKNIREKIEALRWFMDGNEMYMHSQSEGNHNNRLLSVYPIDEENSKWDLVQGDKKPKNGGTPEKRWKDKTYGAPMPIREGGRGWGQPEPGHFKAAMGANSDMLDEILGKPEFRRRVNGGTNLETVDESEDKLKPSHNMQFSNERAAVDNLAIERVLNRFLEKDSKDENAYEKLMNLYTGQDKLSREDDPEYVQSILNKLMRKIEGYD